jgi:hypothetical protein
MRSRVLATAGALLALVGAVFTLQGIGVLGGSFMSGSARWALIGLAMIAAGVIAYGYSNRSP